MTLMEFKNPLLATWFTGCAQDTRPWLAANFLDTATPAAVLSELAAEHERRRLASCIDAHLWQATKLLERSIDRALQPPAVDQWHPISGARNNR